MDRDRYPCPNGWERQKNIVGHRALGKQVLVLCGLFAPCVSLSK